MHNKWNVPNESLMEVSQNIFQLMAQHVGINTFFIAENDSKTVNVVTTLNKNYPLINDGFTIDFQKSY